MGKYAHHMIKPLNLAMGNGNALAKAGGAKPFPLCQALRHQDRVKRIFARCDLGKMLEQRLAAWHRKMHGNRTRTQKFS
jgi:hypothetical protein